MRYFNTNDIQRITSNINSPRIIIESAFIEKRSSSQVFDVFLSHSSKDMALLPAVIKFLKGFDVNVYIDKIDKELPIKTSPETGIRLKKRIAECRKFIVLVSKNSKESKWIPWELGIGDEKKKIDNIALLPTVNDLETPDWPEQEYLGLYPRIAFNKLKGHAMEEWVVRNHHKKNALTLEKWLNRK